MRILDFKDDRPPIRHMISLDGTWQDAENHTNIELLHRSFADRGVDGMFQRKAYFSGVATEGSWFRRAWNGVTGCDLEEKIIEAYVDLCKNYKPGDDIVLTGFSRGAFTARSLNGMIYKCGILKDGENLEKAAKAAYKFYTNKYSPSSPEAEEYRDTYAHEERPRVNLACIDTVGELGVPSQLHLLKGIFNGNNKLHDTTLNEYTKVAIHALALNEKRENFPVTKMKCDDVCYTNSQTSWFAGDHSAVGGGSDKNKGLSDIVGLWIAERLRTLANVGFDQEKLKELFQPNPATNPHADFEPKSWFWNLVGLKDRILPEGAKLHHSVSERYNQVASYRPKLLEGVMEKMFAERLAPVNEIALKQGLG